MLDISALQMPVYSIWIFFISTIIFYIKTLRQITHLFRVWTERDNFSRFKAAENFDRMNTFCILQGINFHPAQKMAVSVQARLMRRRKADIANAICSTDGTPLYSFYLSPAVPRNERYVIMPSSCSFFSSLVSQKLNWNKNTQPIRKTQIFV